MPSTHRIQRIWIVIVLVLASVPFWRLPVRSDEVGSAEQIRLTMLPRWFQPPTPPSPPYQPWEEARAAERHRNLVAQSNQLSSIGGYPCYRTVEETYATAENLVATYPDLATWIDIGDTWEKTQNPDNGYDLMVLRLTNADVPGPKPKLFIMSSVHAREYPPAELNTRFAEYLVDHYGVDPDVTWLLDYHEIHLLLQANPDGRKLAEQGLSHRKNTNDSNGGSCSVPSTEFNQYGTDLNRNFEFYWNTCGNGQCSSGDPCDPLYRGPSAASEPETQAIQDYLRSEFLDLRATPLTAATPITATGLFIDLHNKAKVVLWPWGFTDTVAPNGPALQTLGRKLAYFNHYTPEQSIDFYPADGVTHDFAYGDLGLAAYTIEMGETDFFQDCDTFTRTILPDNLATLLYAAKSARAPYQIPAGPDALSVTVALTQVAPGTPLTLTAVLSDSRYSAVNGIEPSQPISAAEYYVDVPPWVTATTPVAHAMTATDGTFDATGEAVEAVINTSGLSEGRHIVFVRGQDAAGNWGPVSAVFVQVFIPPDADFAADTSIVLGEPLVLTNLTTGTLPIAYHWDFGDGVGTSGDVTPTYTYSSTGVFTVTLVATNRIGADSVGHPVTVFVPPPEPVWGQRVFVNGLLTDVASITVWPGDAIQIVSQVNVSATTGVTFTLTTSWTDALLSTGWSSSAGAVLSGTYTRSWSLVGVSPHVSYGLTQTYQVVSTTWDRADVTTSLWVERAQPQPAPWQLIMDRGNTCSAVEILGLEGNSTVSVGQSTPFTATVIGQAPLTYTWDFGDGTAPQVGLALATVSHTFNMTGTFGVTLTVRNGCPSSHAMSRPVNVVPAPPPPPTEVFLPLVFK